MKVKFVVMLLGVCLCLGCLPAFAAVEELQLFPLDFQSQPDPYHIETPEQNAIQQERMAEYETWLATQQDKTLLSDTPRENNGFHTMAVEDYQIAIPLRRQERNYWCGPASAQELLDYDWGYTGATSKYSQSFLADAIGTTSSSGSYVYKIRNALNAYKKAETSPWAWRTIEEDPNPVETQNEALTIYNTTKQDALSGKGIIYRTRSDPFGKTYKTDVWGIRYGLVAYVNPDGYGSYEAYHYIVGYRAATQANGMHGTGYLDSFDAQLPYGNPYGRHFTSSRNIAACTKANDEGYIIY
ncbi:MAG TPA: hypothetical protein GX505_14215 [Clostridiales bacterium]|nr:hypothetical protein [Clostridiales bacterium]